MLSTPIVLESLDSPLLLETAKFAIYALYTEFVGRCTWLFFNSYALWHLSSKGTVSSTMKRRYVAVDWMTMFGLTDVWTMSGNGSFLSRSAWSVQSLACCRMPCFFALLVGIFAVPSLTNGMKVMPVFHMGCFFLRSNSSMWASSRKTV